ncbi:MAG: caspase family protein [Desulfobacterales bacterium]
MQKRILKLFLLSTYLLSIIIIITNGCGTSSGIRMPEELPAIVKDYKHLSIPPWETGLVNTDTHLNKGDLFTILVDTYYKRWILNIKVEQEYIFTDYYSAAPVSGNLYIGSYHRNRKGAIGIDIIVWKEKDWVQIADFLKKMKDRAPDKTEISHALSDANENKKIYLAEIKTSKEIKKIKVEIEQLTEMPEQEKKQTSYTKEDKNQIVESEKQQKILLLEAKLAKLMQNLSQLEEMKAKLKAERRKSSLLMQELAEKEKREKELITKLKRGSKAPPLILITSPRNENKIETNFVYLQGVVEDDKGLTRLEFFINDKLIARGVDRGIQLKKMKNKNRLEFNQRISLEKGINKIKISANDTDGLTSEEVLTIHFIEKRRNVWAVVIGINNYAHIRHLKYAVNDAKLFYDYMVGHTHIPKENVTLLSNQEASLTQIRSILGTYLKSIAGKDDMVIIYFAGHGATEKDVMSPDGDGLEKYLLPYDANPKDLYATALPMREVSHIFNRIQSERLIFIADSCYSGASGGRTIDITGIRASISDAFLDRLVTGKGRVIMSASGANEVSIEDDEFKHGVFTYYLVEGLKGKADTDEDGLITVDEAYRYVSDKVPQATAQEQHPVKNGTVEGRLILGISQ